METLVNIIIKELSCLSSTIKFDYNKTKFLLAVPNITLKEIVEFLERDSGMEALRICCCHLTPIIELKTIGLIDLPVILKSIKNIFMKIKINNSFKRDITIPTIIDYISLIIKVILVLLPQLVIENDVLFPIFDEASELVKINIPEHFTCSMSFYYLFCCFR